MKRRFFRQRQNKGTAKDRDPWWITLSCFERSSMHHRVSDLPQVYLRRPLLRDAP